MLTATADTDTLTALRPCPVCNGSVFTPVLEPIKKCVQCGLSMVNPVGLFRGENETPEYFLNEYLPLHLANRDNSLAERRAHINSIIRLFRLPAHPRHLDVGCALGFMLQEAKSAGWETIGVETSEFAARYATEQVGCEVHASTLQEARFTSESFDVVTLMDVIEHVADPKGLVSEIYRILRPGGVLFIVTPNFGSFFVRIYGLNAYGVWPDQHIVYFKPRTIEKLLRKTGFQKVVIYAKDLYPDNLKRLFGRSQSSSQEMKAVFGTKGSLGPIRDLVNRIFRYVPVGDKLLAFGQK